ncbi:MAG: tryptophanyl-tRNA synthetase [Saprospiraceae bacterium]|jgi:tryptophanyl-tRNA synthetase
MRPTGRLHLGHYHGVLTNWLKLQEQHDSYFFVADWHALTTHYNAPQTLAPHVWEMVIDWLAAGVDPEKATLFVQSAVPAHAELHLLLSMVTPLSWLERVPSFKDQQAKLKDKDLSTYGFLGYPLLQSADILMYRAQSVPVGEDQVPHVELTREVARRFNHIFGNGEGVELQINEALTKMGKKAAKSFKRMRKDYLEKGNELARGGALQLLEAQQNISALERELLEGNIEGKGRIILPEPKSLLTKASKMPGLDGQKMSKSYGNTIALRDDPKRVEKALRSMPTDPARVRRDDPGTPEKCPVWDLHQVYTDAKTHEWIQLECPRAGIGCVDCKQPLIDAVLAEQAVIRERAEPYENNPALLKSVMARGNAQAQEVANETLKVVREAVGTVYNYDL